MNIIGNIVSSKPIEYDKRINTVNSIDNITNNLPTLIIGYTITKDLHPDKIDFLTKKIEEDLFWTFTLQEKRKVHEIDIENFIQYCYENTIKDISYLFVDPIQFNTRTLKKVINKIYSLDKPVSFLYHDYVYIYGECIIFGIDLHLCEFFFGIKKDKIKNKIKSICNGVLLDDNILIEYKDYLGRLNTTKYIPFLYSLENEQKNSSSIIHLPI